MSAGLTPEVESPSRPSRPADISLYELLTPLVARRRLVAGIAVLCALVSLGFLLLQRPTYTATTSFTPENTSSSGMLSSLVGLAGLAGQLGLGSSSTSSSISRSFS